MNNAWQANCERCLREIDEDEVRYCEPCDLDGLCPSCYNSHDCEA